MSQDTALTTTTPQAPKLPSLVELFDDNIEVAGRVEGLNALLATPPPAKWVKEKDF